MSRRAESLNHAGSRRLADSNCCKASERSVHVNEPEPCWSCGGEGSVTVPAYTAGRRDPENDTDGLCDVCRGAGAVCL